MKLGLLGTGMIIHMALPALNALGVEKNAILSTPRSKEKAEKIASENQIAEVYTDMDDLLANADVDTIYVGLPNALHYEYAKKALEAGKHVIMEKPFSSTGAETEELAKLAQSKNLILAEAVTLLYNPAFLELKKYVDTLGEIKIFSLNFSQYSSRYDRFKKGDIAPAFDPKQSGGSFMDLNVYNINAIFDLFGIPEKMQYFPNMERNIDTSGICIYTYPGFHGVSIAAKDCSGSSVSTIQGTRGYIEIDQNVSVMTSFSVHYQNGETISYSFAPKQDRMYYEFAKFQEWIDSGKREAADAKLALAVEISKAMEASRKEAGVIFACDSQQK